jgi:hypothetical protein
MTKDREQIERCLAVVDAYEASGQKAGAWAAAHGVGLRELASWCAHAERWRARLHGVRFEPGSREPVVGFVAATLSANPSATVRVELPMASAMVSLHWPISHVHELAAWVREVAR